MRLGSHGGKRQFLARAGCLKEGLSSNGFREEAGHAGERGLKSKKPGVIKDRMHFCKATSRLERDDDLVR